MQERVRHNPADLISLGVGYYSTADAARLLRLPARNIRRWLGGYKYVSRRGERIEMPALWQPELPSNDDHIELGFRDLIELRFVAAFQGAGVGTLTIRRCIERAREIVDADRPFSTRRFRTDGSTIFFEWVRQTGEVELLDLKNKQYALRTILDRTFRDLDIEHDVVARWRPFKGKDSVVIDPDRAFGQPIMTEYGVPTITLAEAVEAEGSIERVAGLFELPVAAVRDAIGFEHYLDAA